MVGKSAAVLPPEKKTETAENRIAPPPAPPPEIEKSLDNSGRRGFDPKGSRHFVEVGLVLGGLVGLGVLFVWGGGVLASWAIDWVPWSLDKKLGEAALQQQLVTSEFCSNPHAKKYVEELAEKLIDVAEDVPFPIEIRVVDSPDVNAFALPGGFLTVNYGLLQAAETGEEVAGVIGHEIQHALLRHGTKRMLRKLGGSALSAIVFGGTDFHGYSQVASNLMSLSYDREQESEADAQGVSLLVAANIDPSGLATFFQRLSQDTLQPPVFLSTHPDPGDRAEIVATFSGQKNFKLLPSPQGIACHNEKVEDF